MSLQVLRFAFVGKREGAKTHRVLNASWVRRKDFIRDKIECRLLLLPEQEYLIMKHASTT